MQGVSALNFQRLKLFFIGTALIQLTFLVSGFYLSSNSTALSENVWLATANINSANEDLEAEAKALAEAGNETELLPEIADSTDRQVHYTVARGDSLSAIWRKHGAPLDGALKAAEALKEAGVSLRSLKVGDKIELTLSPAPDVLMLKHKLSDGKILILEGDSIIGYAAKVLEPQVTESQRAISGTIDSSFSLAAREMSLPYGVIDNLVDLFSGRIEFNRDLQPGDTFSVIYAHRQSVDGNSLSPGPIQAASIRTGGKMLVAVRHVSKAGTAYYFDELGQPLGNYFLRYPVQFSRISSVFSESRFHPVLGIKRPHNGVDFAAPIGTPVRSVADGVVVLAGFRGGGGNTVKIQHGNRYSTAYLHLNRIGPGLHRGARVSRGQVIGTVGKTGLATGPHLHFSLFDNGRYVNPMTSRLPASPTTQERIPEQYLLATLQTLEGYHNVVRFASADLGMAPRV